MAPDPDTDAVVSDAVVSDAVVSDAALSDAAVSDALSVLQRNGLGEGSVGVLIGTLLNTEDAELAEAGMRVVARAVPKALPPSASATLLAALRDELSSRGLLRAPALP